MDTELIDWSKRCEGTSESNGGSCMALCTKVVENSRST